MFIYVCIIYGSNRRGPREGGRSGGSQPPPGFFLGHSYGLQSITSDSLAQALSAGTLLAQLGKRGSLCMTGSQCHACKGVSSRGCGAEHAAN
eukprot:1156725-Pelagomonas_calceolata.AAC.9